MDSFGPPLVMGLIALVCLAVAIRSLRRRRLHLDVPTSKAKGVFLGLNEVKGTCRSDRPLRSRLAGSACVWFSWSVEEEWEREVTETNSDGEQETRTESGWQRIAGGGEAIPFEIEDPSGRIRVQPDGAEIEGISSFHKSCGRSHPLYFEHATREAIPDSTGRRRLSESILPVDAELYVIGTARMRDDVVEAEIAESEHGELFLISTKSEEQIVGGHFWATLAGTIVGAGLAGGVGWMFGRTAGAAAGTGSFLGVLAAFWIVLVYNGFVSVRERVEMSRAMLDVQLRRRHVLLPRLQACVAAIAGHERSTQERVAALRGAGELVALVEDYPALKADRNFRQLQTELIETEDRIALAREFVNNSVTQYNNRIERMPGAVVAKLTGFGRRPLLGERP